MVSSFKTRQDDEVDEFLLEKYLVKNFECLGPNQFPICLYDFTTSLELKDVLIFRSENFESLYIEDYFP